MHLITTAIVALLSSVHHEFVGFDGDLAVGCVLSASLVTCMNL